MSCPRSSTLLLLALPIVLLCTTPSSAHRVQKGGCLNYGHSCLGAHGKRASWHPDVRPSSRPPTVPRPLLNIFLNALSTPTSVQYPNVYASTNSVLGRRLGFPERGMQTVPAMQALLSEPGLEVKMGGLGGVLGGLNDNMETLGGRVQGSSDDMDQDAVFYDGTLDDDYTDARYKRNTSPQLARGRTSAGVVLPKATTVRDAADHKDLAVRMMARWLMR